jgi:D-tyrosyl-tRNA(Tyr) deacylase
LKALLQRVTKASVAVNGETVGEIASGLVILLGVDVEDSEREADYLADKTVNIRIFSDEDNKFNLSALDLDAGLLVISQFTLLADTRKGRRPSFVTAAPPEKAKALYDHFVERVRGSGLKVQTGSFGAHMMVNIFNDGPVTILLDSRDRPLK